MIDLLLYIYYLSPLPVLTGFQLRRTSHTLPFKTFTYAPAIVYDTPPTVVDWELLTLSHIEGNHIRIHEFQKCKNLRAAIDQYKSSNALAVVVINTEESLSLSKEIVKSFGDIGLYPVIVLSHSDGDTLLHCMQENEDVLGR